MENSILNWDPRNSIQCKRVWSQLVGEIALDNFISYPLFSAGSGFNKKKTLHSAQCVAAIMSR